MNGDLQLTRSVDPLSHIWVEIRGCIPLQIEITESLQEIKLIEKRPWRHSRHQIISRRLNTSKPGERRKISHWISNQRAAKVPPRKSGGPSILGRFFVSTVQGLSKIDSDLQRNF